MSYKNKYPYIKQLGYIIKYKVDKSVQKVITQISRPKEKQK